MIINQLIKKPLNCSKKQSQFPNTCSGAENATFCLILNWQKGRSKKALPCTLKKKKYSLLLKEILLLVCLFLIPALPNIFINTKNGLSFIFATLSSHLKYLASKVHFRPALGYFEFLFTVYHKKWKIW